MIGNKNMLSGAVGAHDLKAIILQTLFITQCTKIAKRKKVFTMASIVLSLILLLIILSCFWIKKDERFNKLSRVLNRAMVILSAVLAYLEIMQVYT